MRESLTRLRDHAIEPAKAEAGPLRGRPQMNQPVVAAWLEVEPRSELKLTRRGRCRKAKRSRRS